MTPSSSATIRFGRACCLTLRYSVRQEPHPPAHFARRHANVAPRERRAPDVCGNRRSQPVGLRGHSSARASPARAFPARQLRGRGSCRAEWLIPAQVMDHPRIRPGLWFLNELRADRVPVNIVPCVLIFPFRSHSSIPVVSLPAVIPVPVLFRELRLPISNPILEQHIAGLAGKQMNMVGHDDIATNAPVRRQLPSLN